MNKIFSTFLIIIILSIAIIISGCIFNQEKEDPLVGTWVSGEYTNAAGMHYLEIYETFYANNTGTERGYLEGSKTTKWNHLWIKKSENKYEIFYSPITFRLSNNGNTGTGYSTDTPINDWEFARVSGKDTVVGKWNSTQKYMYENVECDISSDFFEDGNGKITLTHALGNHSYTFRWNEIGKDMYVLAMADMFEVEIKEDGKLYDNYGCIYTKT
ncbi:MAG: hypothetical protein Q4Q53_07655 [Methanocorpusculum sp.]|nr:hypothetical protein [Methanocorpusculum sp.]